MSSRIVNSVRPPIFYLASTVYSFQSMPLLSAPQPPLQTLPSTISQMIENLNGSQGTIKIPSGRYTESFNVPDGVNLIGEGVVHVDGTVALAGEGSINFLVVSSVSISDRRSMTSCICNNVVVQHGGFLNCFNSQITKLTAINGQFSVKNSTIGGNPEDEFCIDSTNSNGIVETSTIEGCTMLRNGSVLDCKQTSVIGTEDLFQTENETVTVQLFNCTVYGSHLIKSGAGTSIRANVVPLSDATMFEGGENIKIDSI